MSSSAAVGHPVLACVAGLAAAVRLGRAGDPVLLTDPEKREVLLELTRLVDQVEALRLRVVAVSTEAAADEGARSAAAWLAAKTRSGYGAARRAEAMGEAIIHRWRLVGAALDSGDLRVEQARVIVTALDALPADEVTPEQLAQAETQLVEYAARFDPRQLERLGEKILEIIAPEKYDDLERKALEAAQQRANSATRLTFHRRGDGATDVKARIPDALASRLKTMLEAFTSPRHDTGGDGGAGHGTGGHGTGGHGLGLAQQRDPATGARLQQDRLHGHAFCALLEAFDPARMPVHGGAATRIVITLDYETLRTGLGIATLTTSGEDQVRIPAGEVRRLACQAHLVPAVLGTDSHVLDLGRDSRLFKDRQRLARMLTQSTCAADGCSIPSTWCEAHHRRDPWAHGGTTDLDDLQFLCHWHHQRAHDPAYTTERLPSGDVRFARRT
jgi:Domain of unknown function (DUF222)